MEGSRLGGFLGFGENGGNIAVGDWELGVCVSQRKVSLSSYFTNAASV